MRSLADDGRLVVVATHDERMIPLADRVVNLTPRADTSPREPEIIHLEPGQVLFKQGDRGDLVYVVESGEIEIVRTRDDNTEEQVATIEAGNYFGELAPMFGLQRSAGARAVGPVDADRIRPARLPRAVPAHQRRQGHHPIGRLTDQT